MESRKMRSYTGVRVGLKSNDTCPCIKITETPQGEGHVKTGSEMLPQAKKYLRPPETGRSKERLSIRDFRRDVTLPTP